MTPLTLDIDHDTYWSPFETYFPRLGRYVPTGAYAHAVTPRACVLGASDGKFALPLLRAGWSVTAVETDPLFLHGGTLDLVDGRHEVVGLLTRLEREGLLDRCEIVEADYMTLDRGPEYDLVMGSGLWSQGPNRVHSFAALLDGAMRLVAPSGIFFADYLAALYPGERECGYYPTTEDVDAMLGRAGWTIFENVDLGVRGESHVGLEEWHFHRYAAAITHRHPTRVATI